MSDSKNALSSLINQLVSTKSSGLSIPQFTNALVTTTPEASKSASSSETLASIGLKSASEVSTIKLKSIQFGKPSSNTTSSPSSSSSIWQGLLSQTASGGLASALSGGLSSIAGVGGLISDISKLFGGSSKAAPPPLTLFSLPDSVEQTAYVSSKGTNLYPGDSVEQATKPRAASAIYTSSGLGKTTSGNPVSAATDSAAIAQAVKNALLTSNTLGDVIAEI